MNEEIEEALNGLIEVTPSEEEMNEVRETIRKVEGALSKLPLHPNKKNYLCINDETALGYNVEKRHIYYRDKYTTFRPLLECKFATRKKMLAFIPILIEKLRAQLVEGQCSPNNNC